MLSEDDKREIGEIVAEKIAANEAKRVPYWTMEKIMAILAAIGGLLATATGIANRFTAKDVHADVAAVAAGQAVQVQKAEDVKSALDRATEKQDAATAKQEKTIKKIETVTTEIEDAQGMNLWASYRYLREVAADTGKPEDIAKAAEAKKKYEEYKARPKK